MTKLRTTIKYIFLAFLVVFFLKSCLVIDKPQVLNQIKENPTIKTTAKTPKREYQSIYKNGVDYLVSRGDIGKMGGCFSTSTIGEGPKTFNPWEAKDATSSSLSSIMFEGLTTTDAYSGKIIPRLAKKIEIKNNKEYIITLRRGLLWSDGHPITADDVVFTWQKIIFDGFGNTSTRDTLYINGKLPKVEKIDNLTVKFTTPVPFAPFESQLSTPIAPKHILEPIIKKGKTSFSSFWSVASPPESFVTSGAFILKQYVPAERVVFQKNPNFFMIDTNGAKLPYLERYTTYIVGDLNNEVLKFESGELDVLSVRGNNIARFKALQKQGNYSLFNLGPETGTTFLTFNLNDRKNQAGKDFIPSYKQKWFNDKNFRTAIDYALDREGMVNNVLYGVGAPLFTAESLSSIYLNTNIKGHQKDPEKAKKMLKNSGFYYKNNQLFDKNHNRVEFELLTNAGNTEREAIGVIIKQDLEEIGIKVNFKPIEFNSLVGKLMNTYDWEAIIIGLTGSPLEPHNGRNVWAHDGTMHLFNMNDSTPSAWEYKLDKLFEDGAKVLNFQDRKKYYDEYQQIVYDQKPIIYLYSPVSMTAIRNKFGNVSPTPLGGATHNIEEIFIK